MGPRDLVQACPMEHTLTLCQWVNVVFFEVFLLSTNITLSYLIIAVLSYTTPIKPLKGILPSFVWPMWPSTWESCTCNRTSVCKVLGISNCRWSSVASHLINVCISTPSCTSNRSHEFQWCPIIAHEAHTSDQNGLLPDSFHFSIGPMFGSHSCFFINTTDV